MRNSLVDNIFYSNNKLNLKLLNPNKRKTHKALLTSYGTYEFFLKKIDLFQKVIAYNTKNVFIFSQTKENLQINISNHETWRIFNKTIDINLDIVNVIKNFKFTTKEDKIIENDHKIEIALNFIKDITENIKIIPIILGKPLKGQALKEFSTFLNLFTKQEENSFIFLSQFISHSTNLNKTIQLETTLKKLLLTPHINSSILLEYHNARKIFPENISAIIIMHKIFQKFEFTNREITSNNNEYSIMENILLN
ncbi:AmmeMemoRadiSam system protein B [Borrelia miyamotoi]|uniref:AmmeMemoRadiSam system protein B n=1 Tax=Borrelia miyamotoi TaxID=47466 RepID=A0AAX3JNX6_9SPIR|nr:AmmeMemoRadiSam system protein B [Borrelia miyamotoi]QFP41980.1 AmmeMemoRadiSam system protein B [Borrelia miyamotoi]QFP48422.1 AmmeMemoRadiSam system protein B [Borrelia miyamotoi]QGT56184.1 AmmeMemoRadiSam system protein B [Borrelia miyamotoi]QGT56967.1 AmmeMemoRadiSam system protein B [Borrelia miyamotoi]WAZ72231.1 AmmeMemoRadiSam system protein B [Borrelia miyamotoi]